MRVAQPARQVLSDEELFTWTSEGELLILLGQLLLNTSTLERFVKQFPSLGRFLAKLCTLERALSSQSCLELVASLLAGLAQSAQMEKDKNSSLVSFIERRTSQWLKLYLFFPSASLQIHSQEVSLMCHLGYSGWELLEMAPRPQPPFSNNTLAERGESKVLFPRSGVSLIGNCEQFEECLRCVAAHPFLSEEQLAKVDIIERTRELCMAQGDIFVEALLHWSQLVGSSKRLLLPRVMRAIRPRASCIPPSWHALPVSLQRLASGLASYAKSPRQNCSDSTAPSNDESRQTIPSLSGLLQLVDDACLLGTCNPLVSLLMAYPEPMEDSIDQLVTCQASAEITTMALSYLAVHLSCVNSETPTPFERLQEKCVGMKEWLRITVEELKTIYSQRGSPREALTEKRDLFGQEAVGVDLTLTSLSYSQYSSSLLPDTVAFFLEGGFCGSITCGLILLEYIEKWIKGNYPVTEECYQDLLLHQRRVQEHYDVVFGTNQ